MTERGYDDLKPPPVQHFFGKNNYPPPLLTSLSICLQTLIIYSTNEPAGVQLRIYNKIYNLFPGKAVKNTSSCFEKKLPIN